MSADCPVKGCTMPLGTHTHSGAEWDTRSDQEKVNHPAYYGGRDNPYEVIKVLAAWGLLDNACRFNTIKYLARAGHKDPARTVEDLEKARWYLDYEIARLKGAQGPILASGSLSDTDLADIKAHFAAEARQKPVLLMTPTSEDN